MPATDHDRPVPLDSAAALEELIERHDRVLVEFHTEGCSMCDAMQPVLSNVARASDAVVATMNPRDDPVLIDEYDVRSVPTLLLFVDGERRDTLAEGFVPAEDVLAFLAGERDGSSSR